MAETPNKTGPGGHGETTGATSKGDANNAPAHPNLKDISDQISNLRAQLNADLMSFKEEVKRDKKDELAEFRLQINQQLATTKLTQQQHSDRLEEAEARIEALESWSAIAHDLQDSLKEQQAFVKKVKDLESRARRSNINIYIVPEDSERSSMIPFVEKLLASEQQVEGGTDAQIQRAYRSLGPKTGPNAPPRSIVINYLQHRVKEAVLRNAWKRKIQIGGNQIFFDHNYTSDVVQQRKAYRKIKMILKEKAIRFQTPYTLMRIHWENGPRMYDSAEDA